jgi:hypothetical protein
LHAAGRRFIGGKKTPAQERANLDAVKVPNCDQMLPLATLIMARNVSVNHGLINPLDLYIVNAPIRDFPATLLYCYPVAIL